MQMITAIEIAKPHQLNPKRFRDALRKKCFRWHKESYKRWTVEFNGPEHKDMLQVLNELLRHP
jgi:hypothetical protein